MRKAVEVALAIPATPGAAADAAAVSDFTLSLPLSDFKDEYIGEEVLLLASSSVADGFDSFVSKGIVGVCCTLLLTVVTLSGGLEVVPIDDIDVVVSGRLLVVELFLSVN